MDKYYINSVQDKVTKQVLTDLESASKRREAQNKGEGNLEKKVMEKGRYRMVK